VPNFLDLTSASCGLDILKVDFLVLVEIDDGAKVEVETCFNVSREIFCMWV